MARPRHRPRSRVASSSIRRAYYFRTAIRFETSAAQYPFFNRLVAISSGDRRARGPIYMIEEIL